MTADLTGKLSATARTPCWAGIILGWVAKLRSSWDSVNPFPVASGGSFSGWP
jgi:hypothetical protein